MNGPFISKKLFENDPPPPQSLGFHLAYDVHCPVIIAAILQKLQICSVCPNEHSRPVKSIPKAEKVLPEVQTKTTTNCKEACERHMQLLNYQPQNE